MSVFSGDDALLLNAFYFLTFPTIAVSSYVTQRWLGAERPFAAVSSLVFMLLPAHFYRGAEHIFLSSYAVVPLGVLLAVRAGTGRLPWSATSPGPRALLRALPWLGVIVLVASCGSYYWMFSLLVVGLVAAYGAVRFRDWRPVFAGAATVALAVIVFALNNVGSILYWRSHGSNPEVGARDERGLGPVRDAAHRAALATAQRSHPTARRDRRAA